ncbi:MAG TPA: GspH/FimT family protein [Lacunisphaera sp.]|nr:GspH/FimT family protein [Lacunisphaera sp.]
MRHGTLAQRGPTGCGTPDFGPRAFTLVESLLVLALLVLGAAALLPAAGAVFRRARLDNPEERIGAILQQARREAVLRGREVVMHFDAKAQRFEWDGDHDAGPFAKEARLEVEFVRPGARSAVLIGGQLVETSLQPAMRFFPDGTCEPIRLQWRVARGAVRTLAIDPWTCAFGLEDKP